MVNYAMGKVYKIQNINGEGEVYVGSTTKEYLSQRMEAHRSAYKRWKTGKGGHIRSYDLFESHGVENCNIVLLEAIQAQSKDELHAREAFWIKSLKCVNKSMPGRSKAEYCEECKQEILLKMKQYYEDHKEEILQQKKVYREKNKKEISQKLKQYYEENKEEFIQKGKEYREEHREEINQKAKDKCACACGGKFTYANKSPHERTKKHQQFITGSPDSVKVQDE